MNFEVFKNSMTRLAPLTDAEFAKFIDLAKPQPKTILKDQYFCETGQTKVRLGFILKGLFRVFINTSEGKVYIKDFRKENQFLGCYSSMILHRPVNVNIQAIEDSEILAMDAFSARKVFEYSLNWQQVGRLIAEHFYCQYEDRQFSQITDPADIRYDKFVKNYPDLINRVSQKDIAHYLGINPVSLSRIRSARLKN